jgi:hypothetical protein
MKWKYSGWRVGVTTKEPIAVVGEHVGGGRGRRVIAHFSVQRRGKRKMKTLLGREKISTSGDGRASLYFLFFILFLREKYFFTKYSS